ncbi:MAG: PAS domain-containing sensor histidine kinase [Flavobacterium sp.]|nr:MAG: PAS domain-containing sensor histidine kinase [Flavobacterium sp.]
MEAILENAPCLYFSCSEEGQIIHCNQFLCKKLGYEKDELIGKKIDTIFTVATRIFQQTHFFPLLKMQGFAEEIFITLQTSAKEQIPVLLNAERKSIDQQVIFIYTGIIVYNRKKFEDELVAARKAAESALNENTQLLQAKLELQKNIERLDREMSTVNRRNEELLQFNKVVTHDLQEPLRKLFVFSTMMQESTDREMTLKTLQRVQSSSEQMRSILSGLQQYVWLTEVDIKYANVNFSHLLLLVKSELEQENKQVKINLEIDDIPPIEADHEQMRFLLYEVLSNAIRFRSHDDLVTVKVSANRLLLNQFKNISGKYKYADHLRLQIKDDGLGFDATYKDQVFELFKRLHPVSGRGVGLSLCKKIVENHHGTISVDSEKGQGTTISIFLPFLTTELSLSEKKKEKHEIEE